MPLIRKSSKIISSDNNCADEKNAKIETTNDNVPAAESEGRKSDAASGKPEGKAAQRSTHKENVPRPDSCGRNGIIRFPLIPGVTLQRRKTGKQLKAAKHAVEASNEAKKKAVPTSSSEPLKERRVKFAEVPVEKSQEPSKTASFSPKTEHKTFYPRFKSNLGLLPELVVPQVPEIVLAELVPEDPISACLPCLEANGTYICTPCNPRCYIIQKVTTSPTGVVPAAPPPPAQPAAPLNPEAMVFEATCQVEGAASTALGSVVDTPVSDNNDPPWTPTPDYDEGYAYMNGDVGKLPSGAVYSTPEPILPPAPDYSSVNGVSEEAEHYEGGGEGGEATATTPADATAPSTPDTPAVPMEQLKQMLSSQLEYYFSRENLANDAYLLSQMDNDQYVPIWTVANFNQVKKLTTDIKLITQVLRESPNVQVDEEGQKVRPNHKRCIVILREIPDSTPLEQVKELFSGEGCPKVISCEFAHNSSWYVTFESDEDAQRAYRFLREEVKEFQGKPIMARIKAKPMHRMTMSAVGGGPMKNGYRSPPVFDPASGPFQPAGPAPGPQQSFLYANGSSIPTPVSYSNQPLHVYTFPQTNQPFYPPPMLQPWGAANTFFDIGSVFSVNGLAPQQSFNKPAAARYVPRSSRSSTKRPSSDRGTASESPTPRPQQQSGTAAPASGVTATATVATAASPIPVVAKVPGLQTRLKSVSGADASHTKDNVDSVAVRLSDSLDVNFRQSKDKSDSSSNGDRHRRRRKDEEGGAGGRSSPSGSQFDLEASAFPPLPAGAIPKPVNVETETAPQSHWGENRLADVVKGTAKHKGTLTSASTSSTSTSTTSTTTLEVPPPDSTAPPVPPAPAASPKPTPPPSADHGQPSSENPWKSGEGSSPAAPAPATTPVAAAAPAATATVAVATATDAPANSSCDANTTILTPPPSPIKCVVPVPKCATADKATKTDDILLNGDAEKVEKGEKPATTNAATMTTEQLPPQSPVPSDVPPRLSYAQVAQHAKEKGGEKVPPEPERERERKKEGSCSRDVRMLDKEKREEGFREVTSRAASRASSRQAAAGNPRRREGTARPPRDAK